MVSSTTAATAPRRGWRWAALFVTVALLSACTGQPSTSTPPPAHTLVVGATLEPPTMNPSASSAASIPQVLLYNVYETLVKMDPAGDLKPWLAQSWKISTNRLVYTFQLNPAAHFASGKPVTAQAVVTSFNRIKTEPTIQAPLVEQMAVVKSTEAVDDHTVKVTLNRPSNLWLYDISSTAGIIYDPDGLATLDTTPAGSGPFVLRSWNKGQSVVLAVNPSYWGTAPRLDTVTFRYLDANAMNAAMLSGDIDVVSNLQAPDALSQFSDSSRFTVIEGTTTGEVVLALNNARPAFKDVRVRRAISMAIDKKALLDTVWNGKGTLIGSMSVPTDPWYEDLTSINAYNVAGAKKLLSEAKVSNLSLKLRVPTTAYATKSAQFVESALRQVGIKVIVEELDFPTWLTEVHGSDKSHPGGNYDMSIVAHVEARDLRRFTDPNYYFHYDNPTYNKQFEAADEAPADQLVPLMRKAVRTLAQDAAAVWLFALPNLVITKPTVTGIPTNAATLSFDVTMVSNR